MTNTLVGDVYQKIIEEVVSASSNDFEESGVMGSTLEELRQEWQAKLSARQVAQMPWDPKPQPPVQQPPPSHMPSAAANGMPPQAYPPNPYATGPGSGNERIKMEPGTEQQQYNGLPNVAYQNGNGGVAAGGLARAQHLVQQQYGAAGNASINAMQQRGGLALPGQQAKPQGLSLPAGTPQNAQQTYQQQQHVAMAHQQQQLAQQQAQPRIKVENDSPQLQQGSFNQQSSQGPNYSQTDGADEGLEEWKAMLAERRAVSAEQTRHADRMMHDHVANLSANLQSGLMVPLDQQPKRSRGKQRQGSPSTSSAASSSRLPTIPQLDGEAEEDEEKPSVKDEDDENAINSDLDDSDDEGGAGMGDDDDEEGDNILCTYDKVQRVKNKWKCTLKDGVMSVDGKEGVFHKGMGEFEW